MEVADPTFYLAQSQYTDTGPTSPSADPITPGAWQGCHWRATRSGMDKDSKGQRKMEDSGGGLLPAVEGYSLE